jgi:hypothetical protein
MSQLNPQDLQRRKIRVNGGETVVDVAVVVFKDRRLAPLLSDLNPTLPQTGPLAAGAVVTCPSKVEAAAFAKKMGFTLGFDEKQSNGTKQKRAWQKMQGPGQASHAGIDAEEAARTLLAQKIAPAEVGKRLAKLATPEALERFLATPSTDAAVATVQKAVELHVAFPKAHGALLAAAGVVDATARPSGLLALLQAVVDDEAAAVAAMAAVLIPKAAQEALVARAPDVVRAVARAEELAKIERGARDATLAVDKDAVLLRALVAAVVDRVDVLAGDRLALVGLAAPWEGTTTHLARLKEMLGKHDELLPRAGSEVLTTLAGARDGSKLPKPWPVIAAVVKGLAPLLEQTSVDARDRGVGGLVRAAKAAKAAPPAPETSTSGTPRPSAPVMSAASLLARAATGAKSVDEGAAIADRLAPTVVALVDLVRPLSGDTGPTALRRAKRRSFYDGVVIATSAPQGDAIGKLVDDVFADARRTGFAGVDKVQKAQQLAARDVAKSVVEVLSVHQKNASELGRALIVVAMTLDRDLGGLLLRATGKEAFRAHVEKHGGKLLSKAALVYAEPPSS